MYPYHNKIKQRINQGELTGFKFIENHARIKGKVLMLYFRSEPFERPIRPHRFKEYEFLTKTNKDGKNIRTIRL